MNAGKEPTRDWRAHPPTQSAYAREWRGPGGGSASGYSRNFKLRMAGSGLILLIVLLGFLILLRLVDQSTKVQILSYGISAYGGRQDNPSGTIPVNPFGEQDATAFEILHSRRADQFLEIPPTTNVLNYRQFLDDVKTRSSRLGQRNLIVFCTMHGAVQPDGRIALFAIDAIPGESENQVPYSELLEILGHSDARHVLLVLDAARLESSWNLGILTNDIAEHIVNDWRLRRQNQPEQTGQDKRKKNSSQNKLAILLAASSGQKSWLQHDQSALVHFLIEGLNGAADGWTEINDQPKSTRQLDQRVTLRELAAYTRSKIDDWARRRYGVGQTIRLLDDGEDYDIADVPTSGDPLPDQATKIAESKLKLKPVETTATEGQKVDADTAKPETDAATEKTASGLRWNDAAANELWNVRDRWRDESAADGRAVRRQSPFLWRVFNSNLLLAESLKRAGQERLACLAIQRADDNYKRLKAQADPLAVMNWSTDDISLLAGCGFSADSKPAAPTAPADKELNELLAEPGPNSARPMSPAIRTALLQLLLQQTMAEKDKQDIQKILKRLTPTPDVLFLRNLTQSKSNAAQTGPVDLRKLFELWDRCRWLAVRYPESWASVNEDFRYCVRSLDAAERWILATDTSHPEAIRWIGNAESRLVKAEKNARLYDEAIGQWIDLVSELPVFAEWAAKRANDTIIENDQRDLKSLFAEGSFGDGSADMAALANRWPDKPRQLVDFERKLLGLFADAKRLRNALMASNEPAPFDDLSTYVKKTTLDRNEFKNELNQIYQSTNDKALFPPEARRESVRLLDLLWLPREQRSRLDKLQTDLDTRALEQSGSSGERLPDRNRTTGAVWQGFWAIATLDLFTQQPADTKRLWDEWRGLVDRSNLILTEKQQWTDLDLLDLRKRRASLGQNILLFPSTMARTPSDQRMPSLLIRAARQDPFRPFDKDPDVEISAERRNQFGRWLAVASATWSSRALDPANPSRNDYQELAKNGRTLTRTTADTANQTDTKRSAYPRFHAPGPLSFNANRELELKVAPTTTADEPPPTQARLFARNTAINVAEGEQWTSLERPLTRQMASGAAAIKLRLKNDVKTPQDVLVVLSEDDDFPIEFIPKVLNPPFNPDWTIELAKVEKGKETRLETESLSASAMLPASAGTKILLPPKGPIDLAAFLNRPPNDVTESVKIEAFGLSGPGPTPDKTLLGAFQFDLKPGDLRIQIKSDPPPAPPPGTAPAAPKTDGPKADVAHGILFEITPKGQKTISYVIRPRFYSESKFVEKPEPLIKDNRMSVVVRRKAASGDAQAILPKKIPINLNVPLLLGKTTDSKTSDELESGANRDLYANLPESWKDLAKDRELLFTLDVAELRHAYVWKLEQTGVFTPKEQHVGIRLVQRKDPKDKPVRVKPIIVKGVDELNLQFEVNSSQLNAIDVIKSGDWELKSQVSRLSESGPPQPTSIAEYPALYSSLERHVFLDDLKEGVWKLHTDVSDYSLIRSVNQLRGESANRCQVESNLVRASDQQPLATARFQFAIEEEGSAPKVHVPAFKADQLKNSELSFSLEATDPESGIQRVRYGFDANDDKMLQDNEVLKVTYDTTGASDLDAPSYATQVVIPEKEMKFTKDEETRQLIVEAQNGLGETGSIVRAVKFKSPPKTNQPTTGSLVIKFKISRGARSTIDVQGAQTQKTEGDTVTFDKLTPGPHKVNVTVNYMVIGIDEAGEETATVEAGKSKTIEISLKQVKPK